MTGIPEFLLDSPHLPLKAGQVNQQVVDAIALVYGLQLNPDDYKKTQVYRGSDGMLRFDLFTTEGVKLTSFVDKSSGTKVFVPIADDTPTLTFGTVNSLNWLAKNVTLFDQAQLEIFSTLPVGFIYDAMENRGEFGFVLAELLNNHTEEPVWMLSSFAPYSTAKFELVYQGVPYKAPVEMNLPTDAQHALVLNILSGKHQGLVCFLVT